jgi:DNA-binding NtrC family response regulator
MNRQTLLQHHLEDPAISRNEQAQLRCQLAKELEEAGHFEAARKALGELWQGIGEHPQLEGLDSQTAAEVLLRVGVLSGWVGRAKQIEGAQETAKNLISESINIFESLQKREKMAEAYIDLGVCYWREGAYDEARVTLLEALRQIADKDSELKARALLNSAIVEISTNHYSDALHILDRAAPLFQALDNHALKGQFHINLGITLKNLSEGENHEDYIDRALVEYAAASYHFEQAKYTRFRAYTENNLGFLLFTLGRFEEAHGHLDRARLLFADLKDPGSVAQVDETRARVLIAQHRTSEAERIIGASVRTLERGGQQSLLAEALTTQATALAHLGRYEESRSTLQRAIDVARQAGALSVAGLAALTIIEELNEQLSFDELQSVYELADHLLADSQHPQTLHRLRQAARRVIVAGQAREQETEVGEARAPNFVYRSEQIATLLRTAHRVAVTHSPVLITGETGTGKGILARLIHEWSGVAGEFVAINCATLTDTLIESEIFGHRQGSFDDAVEDQPGAVRKADGGTLFLDGISELNIGSQGKLLRLIEHGEVHSVGASRPERVEVRIVAATIGNLKDKVTKELFRPDLYYRLQSFHLHIPPLRERREDIPVLVEHFIEETFERYGQRVRFTLEAVEAIGQFPLRGNARELRSLIERAALTTPHGAAITREAFERLALRSSSMSNPANAWTGCVLSEEVHRYENSLIRMALDATQGHISRAARLLGITHQGLAFILEGRQQDLLSARTPVKRRRRSITGKRKRRKS